MSQFHVFHLCDFYKIRLLFDILIGPKIYPGYYEIEYDVFKLLTEMLEVFLNKKSFDEFLRIQTLVDKMNTIIFLRRR